MLIIIYPHLSVLEEVIFPPDLGLKHFQITGVSVQP
jgi:hypothetical protein